MIRCACITLNAKKERIITFTLKNQYRCNYNSNYYSVNHAEVYKHKTKVNMTVSRQKIRGGGGGGKQKKQTTKQNSKVILQDCLQYNARTYSM